jgi:hypothetical protein
VWRPWLNSAGGITLAIALDGVALRQSGETAKMISKESLLKRDYQVVFDALQQHQNLLENQKVSLLISNHFMRFSVLPWQKNVYSRQDWLALANHAFRQQYGAVADSWQVRVSLGGARQGYGQAVIASAIDQALYDGLIEVAQQLNFSWQAIEPLTMCLLNHSTPSQAAWILIAEPEHLLLCESYQGQFQRFSVAAPPAGQESIFATQMIARAQLLLERQQQPSQTAIFVSGKLTDSWPKDSKVEANASHELVFAKQKHLYHAGWLASL